MKVEKFPHTRKSLHWRRWEAVGGSIGATEERATIGVQRAKCRDFHTEDHADQHSPAQEDCLLTLRSGWRLGAEAQASEFRTQGEDWGWLCEHSLKGASAPQLAGREYGKMSATA